MLILGSSSPRRKEILSYFRVLFDIRPSSFDESQLDTSLDPVCYVETMAKKKAEMIPLNDGDVLLCADTVVVLGEKILGKPSSIDQAIEMLLSLSQKSHDVITGVCVRKKDHFEVASAITHVTLLPITEEKARAYATHFGVLDKAGGYAVQDGGGIIVEKIDGCFYNAMGLPLRITIDMLRNAGIYIWDILGKS